MDFSCNDLGVWKEALSAYESRLESLNKPELIQLDRFYRKELPLLLHKRNPNPNITKPELTKLMQWKLSRGKWRPRLQGFVLGLEETQVTTASQRAFETLPDLAKAVTELTALKGVGPATASAILAAYAPDIAPFMSDEAMVAVLGNSKEYTLKQYLTFAEKLQTKAMELSTDEDRFTPSDAERALWSSAVGAKLTTSSSGQNPKSTSQKSAKRKRSHDRKCLPSNF